MEDYIAISTLNDFIFCPYSIYLHNVYMETDESVYHATPQKQTLVSTSLHIHTKYLIFSWLCNNGIRCGAKLFLDIFP